MGNYKDEILGIASTWNEEQLHNYIRGLEERIIDTHLLLKELKALRKRKFSNKKVYDTGLRSGG